MLLSCTGNTFRRDMTYFVLKASLNIKA